MEIRVLRYFLETAREGNITRAAERLHVTQPTMSRQLKDLEEELGKKLFVRTNYALRLTEAGLLLRKRAEDILDLVDKTETEFKMLDDTMGGEIFIGCPESDSLKYFARALKRVQGLHPGIRCNITSGNSEDITEKLDKGILDFALVMEYVNPLKYNHLEIPAQDTWGVFMRKDSPLAKKKSLRLADLCDLPLICSRQNVDQNFPAWFGEKLDRLNIVATYNLFFNASIFVKEGLGYAIGYDKLAHTGKGSDMTFVPLADVPASEMKIIWKKYQVFSPVASLLLAELQKEYGGKTDIDKEHN